MSRLVQVLILGGVGFVLIFGPLAFGIYSRDKTNKTLEGEIESTRKQVDTLRDKTSKQKAKEQLYADIENVFNDLVEILPLYSPEQADSIWNALTAYRSLANLDFQTISWDDEGTRGGRRAKKGDFEEINLNIQLSGRFFDFLRFLREVERHPSFLRVDNIILVPSGERDENGDMIHSINLKLTTFHYVVG
ncbi:type 4a pilus biogenesis protein PilO [Planctomycetota bacterium]